jgi:membrane protein implicated in regulation of membrane protease activity
MFDWFESITVLQKVFVMVGGVGALLFLVQLVLMFVAGDGDMEDPDIDLSDDVHADSDVGFKLLTLQGISVFLLMFGLVGLACNRGGDYPPSLSIGIASAVGLLFMYFIAKMFSLFHSLQSSGTIDLQNAVGKIARVYLTIKSDGRGKIEVELQGHLSICDAITRGGEDIPTDAKVKVIEVLNDTMIVERM